MKLHLIAKVNKTAAEDEQPHWELRQDWRKKYDSLWSFHEGLAAVELNGKWGFIDKMGNLVIGRHWRHGLTYDAVGSFSEGLAAVELNGKWGFVNKKGREVIKLKYDWVDPFSKGLARVRLDGKWGLIDLQGNEINK